MYVGTIKLATDYIQDLIMRASLDLYRFAFDCFPLDILYVPVK